MQKQLFADRYRIESRLGVGGMAVVELAFDTRLERYVAVKLLAEHLADDSAFLSRFKREALAAARLVNPNIVQVFDFGTDKNTGRSYIVMEHIDGRSCSDLLREFGWLSPAEAVDILIQACRGLDYAHRNGVIHRDVKPGNLLRNHEGVVKLADFGIAKAAEQSDITKLGSVLGTAAYLSPEQTRGESANTATDLYALGVVAYQLLTGRLPYESTSLPDLARQQEMGAPIPPCELNPEIPITLSTAVMRSLAGDPSIRCADAREMEQNLIDGLEGIGPTALPVSTAPNYHQYEGGNGYDVYSEAASATALVDQSPPTQLQQWSAPSHSKKSSRSSKQSSRSSKSRNKGGHQSEPRKRRRGPLRFLVFLLVIAALVGAGIFGVQMAERSNTTSIHLNHDVKGSAEESLDAIEALLRDNSR